MKILRDAQFNGPYYKHKEHLDEIQRFWDFSIFNSTADVMYREPSGKNERPTPIVENTYSIFIGNLDRTIDGNSRVLRSSVQNGVRSAGPRTVTFFLSALNRNN